METEKKKVLVLGMYEEAMYHPMKGVDTYLQKICPEVEFTFTEEPADLCEAEQYDGVISYWDDWNTPDLCRGSQCPVPVCGKVAVRRWCCIMASVCR